MSKVLANNVDDNVDIQISECLNPTQPKSFFLFAGAGSGKTRSLVECLKQFKKNHGLQFALKNQKIAIITYTNAAADEIKQRLKFDPIFYVSTIHSFAWELIKNLTSDIKGLVMEKLEEDLLKLKQAQLKSKNLQNKTSIDRARKIEAKQKRKDTLSDIIQFTYNPNGNNYEKDALSHSEVIAITAQFIANKPLMQDILVARFPIILIDESQDTKKELMESFFELQAQKKDVFSLGLFGDTMQRIYADGKPDLGVSLPDDWLRPAKKMNHRSNKRIIHLINDIRSDVDEQVQQPRKEKADGFVRLFLVNRTSDKSNAEKEVAKRMATITKDKRWLYENEVQALILEHHMAALRMGFAGLFEPLYKVDRLRTGLLDGTLSSLNIFTKTVLPLVEAKQENDKFAIARIIKAKSLLLKKYKIADSKNQVQYLEQIQSYVETLLGLWDGDKDPSIKDILKIIHDTQLFPLSGALKVIASRTEDELKLIEEEEESEDDKTEDERPSDEVIDAWDLALDIPFSQVINYSNYISEESRFATHQGVKGLEYDRVAVIIDDAEARGFLFSYDKLFGAKELTATDKSNKAEGKDTGVDRTRRLFYVACSRAKESLAIIAYTDNPEVVKENAQAYGWFRKDEIEILGSV